MSTAAPPSAVVDRSAQTAAPTARAAPPSDDIDELNRAFDTLKTAIVKARPAPAPSAESQQLLNAQLHIISGLQSVGSQLDRLCRLTEANLQSARASESSAARMANLQMSWVRREGPYKVVPNALGQDPTSGPTSLPGIWYPEDLLKLSKQHAMGYLQFYGYDVDPSVRLVDAKYTIAAEVGMAAIAIPEEESETK